MNDHDLRQMNVKEIFEKKIFRGLLSDRFLNSFALIEMK